MSVKTPLIATFSGVSALLALSVSGVAIAGQGTPNDQGKAAMMAKLESLAPYKGYLEAHSSAQPQELLGGPLAVDVSQDSGGVHVALPDNRELDPAVFGTPETPRAFGGAPGVNGVPLPARGVEDGHYTTMKEKTPFGDANVVMGNGKLKLHLVDRTATDAAATEDEAKFDASWQDKDGNTYEVRCCAKMAAHGVDYPTFGGVVTNHILHGSSRIGTALMPTEYTYAAFWGMGEILKNGKVVDKPRLVHGMLTEYVRTTDYKLGFDKDITPSRRHFHLMVPPVMPVMGEGHYEKKPVQTGFKLPNGMELPFWHVMFSNLDIQAGR